MRIGIIIGSHRDPSQSSKVGHYAEHLLRQNHKVDLYELDLHGNPLPLWDESKWSNGDTWQEKWSPISQELQVCDGFVVVSPEWGGMVPAGLKNFFLLCDNNELAHKPALIVSVSSGRGGAYPVAELRMSSYKNTHITYLPEHVIVRDVEHVLNDYTEGADTSDTYIKKRLAWALDLLVEYTNALTSVRSSDAYTRGLEEYEHGM